MYNDNSKAKQHNPYNRSVYSGQSKCNFIPNCAYEKEHISDIMPNGIAYKVYISDNGQYMRAVLFKNTKVMTGFCGLLFEVKSGRIVYVETNPADRGKGNYKQLMALTYLAIGKRLWSDFQSNDLLKVAHMLE